jgi:hypothetical protein
MRDPVCCSTSGEVEKGGARTRPRGVRTLIDTVDLIVT